MTPNPQRSEERIPLVVCQCGRLFDPWTAREHAAFTGHRRLIRVLGIIEGSDHAPQR